MNNINIQEKYCVDKKDSYKKIKNFLRDSINCKAIYEIPYIKFDESENKIYIMVGDYLGCNRTDILENIFETKNINSFFEDLSTDSYDGGCGSSSIGCMEHSSGKNNYELVNNFLYTIDNAKFSLKETDDIRVLEVTYNIPLEKVIENIDKYKKEQKLIDKELEKVRSFVEHIKKQKEKELKKAKASKGKKKVAKKPVKSKR